MNEQVIDFVVTWVDGSDPIWLEKKRQHIGNQNAAGNAEARYRDWDLFKYWFRGVEKFAPWVRYVFLITDDQKPEWLNTEHPKLKWIKHTDYIPEEYLPTFNSHTIEWNLHRIEELSNQFVYFNDDVFLIRDTRPEDFFVKGVPCDRPEIEAIYPVDFFSNILFNNAMLLNRHTSLKISIRKHWRKWFKYQSPRSMLKMLLYGRKDAIPGFAGQHIHIPYLKESFLELWEKESPLLHETCKHKQRTTTDVNHFCIQIWRCLRGEFYPSKPIGKAFSTAFIDTNGAVEYLRKQKGKVICLNDSEFEIDFDEHKRVLDDLFSVLLPGKSSFER